MRTSSLDTAKTVRFTLASVLLIGAGLLLLDGLAGRLEEYRRDRPEASIELKVAQRAELDWMFAHGNEHALQAALGETLISTHTKGNP